MLYSLLIVHDDGRQEPVCLSPYDPLDGPVVSMYFSADIQFIENFRDELKVLNPTTVYAVAEINAI